MHFRPSKNDEEVENSFHLLLNTATTPEQASSTIKSKKKNTFIAIVLAFIGGVFLLGLGHFYIGRILRGILLLVTGVVLRLSMLFITENLIGNLGRILLMVNIFSIFTLWILQTYDAYRLTK
ncbi:MAG: hypothetical protein QXI68_01745 [Sulfolobales archaeon]